MFRIVYNWRKIWRRQNKTDLDGCRPVYRMCAQVAPSGECLRGKGPPDRMLANLGAVCFWQPIPSGLNLVVAAVLRDSLCVVSLLPCVADCCMLNTVCKVERFVLTIIERILLLSLLRLHNNNSITF